MTISERRLKKWRREALQTSIDIKTQMPSIRSYGKSPHEALEDQGRILQLTQELLDQHLLKKEQKQ